MIASYQCSLSIDLPTKHYNTVTSLNEDVKEEKLKQDLTLTVTVG